MGRGAVILAPAGPDLGPDESRFFRDADPLGFILFARNVSDAEGTRRLTAALRDAVGRDAPILIDQEGGRVQRLRPPLARDWLPPLDQCALAGPRAARAMELRAILISAELLALGIDANCAPTADIATPATHPFLRNRCYGTTADDVTPIARACADGHLAMGVIPVVKHAPGHGRATADSHHDLPRIDAPLDDYDATDAVPFRALADLPMAMTAHLLIPAIDPDRPVTLSPAGLAYLRDRVGLTGFLMTDDISMQALSGTPADRAAAAIAAGCDAVLHCNGDASEMAAVAAAAGALTPAAEARLDAALALRHPATRPDIQAAEAELADILERTDA